MSYKLRYRLPVGGFGVSYRLKYCRENVKQKARAGFKRDWWSKTYKFRGFN